MIDCVKMHINVIDDCTSLLRFGYYVSHVVTELLQDKLLNVIYLDVLGCMWLESNIFKYNRLARILRKMLPFQNFYLHLKNYIGQQFKL